jgi:hypothetical protein
VRFLYQAKPDLQSQETEREALRVQGAAARMRTYASFQHMSGNGTCLFIDTFLPLFYNMEDEARPRTPLGWQSTPLLARGFSDNRDP